MKLVANVEMCSNIQFLDQAVHPRKRKVSFLALLHRNLPLMTRLRLNQAKMHLTVLYAIHQPFLAIGGILVYNICSISISNLVSDGATNTLVLNIERTQRD